MTFHEFSRRIFLCLLLVPALKAKAQSDTLSFMHVTDTHLIFDLEQHHPEIVTRRKHYGNGILPLQHLLDSVSSKGDIRFVAITGDMIDFYSATTEKGEIKTYQIEQFSRLVDRYPVPVFLNPGNHDVSAYAWNGEKITSSQRIAGKARAAWIHAATAFKEGTHYSRLMNVGDQHYRLIFLDNGYNSAGDLEKSKPPYLDRVQLEWLKEQLNESADDIEIVLMHIPFGEDVAGSELYEVLASHRSLKLILAGHEHVNLVKTLASPLVTQVQTGAFARDPQNWRKISLTETAIVVSQPGSQKPELVIAVE